MPSTAIRRLAYRADAAALDVEFTTGKVYRYFDVPRGVARGLTQSQIKGIYFNRVLRALRLRAAVGVGGGR